MPWGLVGGGTGHGHLARQRHGYINVPWRRREAAGSSKQCMARAERGLSVIASSYQGTQRPICSCPSRRLGREQHVLCEAGRRRGSGHRGSPPAKALTGIGRALSRSRRAQVLLASQSVLAQSLSWVLGGYRWVLRSHYPAPARQLSLTVTHSLPSGGWAALGSSSACTNHSAFLLCVDLSGVACVFRDFSAVPPLPPVCSDSGGEGAEQPPA